MNLNLHFKQGIAFESTADEQFYGGAAGGGKSHLIRIIANHYAATIPNCQVYLFRRTYGDLIKNHVEGPGGFNVLLAPMIKSGQVTITDRKISYWNGSNIHLCHCQHEKDRIKYQGAEIHVLLIDELTHFTETIYKYLRGRCRASKELVVPEGLQLPRIMCSGNPGGIGHNWVKHTFVDNAPAGEIVQMPKPEGGMRRQYIISRLEDNPSLDMEDYEGKLAGLGPEHLVKAMRDGDWDIVAGGAIDDVWNREVHVIPRQMIPAGWRIDRGFDWGSSSPFSVLWFAESDGSPMGGVYYPRGSIVAVREWYGAKPGTEDGLRMTTVQIAEGILERESDWGIEALPGPADNQINAVVNGECFADQMRDVGVTWTRSNKGPGSRTAGLDKIREMLRVAASDRPEKPGFWIMDCCPRLISHIPVLKRDEKNLEDVDTHQDDHDYDVVRYKLLGENLKMSVGGSPIL